MQRGEKTAFEEAKYVEDPNARLNACRNIMGKAVIEGMDDSNNFYAMVHSGSKGSLINLTQVQACLGQMNVQGGRMPLQWRNRTATHFERGEDGPTSRGFVSHSFLEGLTPFEMYAHSMSGREGLIDTAIKTAQTGYTERKLMKCLENITTHFDGTVRDGDRIVQFLYGDDGFDGAKVETQHVKPLVGAIQKDLDMLTKSHYHFPVPVHRIVRRMELFGGVQKGCGPPVDIDSDNELLKAARERAHPQHDPKHEGKVRARDSKVSRQGKDMSWGVCRGARSAEYRRKDHTVHPEQRGLQGVACHPRLSQSRLHWQSHRRHYEPVRVQK